MWSFAWLGLGGGQCTFQGGANSESVSKGPECFGASRCPGCCAGLILTPDPSPSRLLPVFQWLVNCSQCSGPHPSRLCVAGAYPRAGTWLSWREGRPSIQQPSHTLLDSAAGTGLGVLQAEGQHRKWAPMPVINNHSSPPAASTASNPLCGLSLLILPVPFKEDIVTQSYL